MQSIKIKGAREHNLKNIDIEIPRDKLVVITGLSGSGKSSLAFDTLYAEGQRRYVESLSAYARQFLGMMEKPDVDYIEGLSPAISIDQKSSSRNPRSTVGTVTEIYDYLRLLFARIGTPHCYSCGAKVDQLSSRQIVDRILVNWKHEDKIMLLAPLVRDRKGEHKSVFGKIVKSGFPRVRVDGVVMDIEEAQNLNLDKQLKHSIEVVIDRIIIEKTKIDNENKKDDQASDDQRLRIMDSVEKALKISEGHLVVRDLAEDREFVFTEKYYCAKCDLSLPPIEPRSFSFNSPHGACPACQGLGTKQDIDQELVVPNDRLTIAEGAIRPWSRTTNAEGWYIAVVEKVGETHGFSINEEWRKISEKHKQIILLGTGEKEYMINGYASKFEGIIPNLLRRYKDTDSDYIRSEIEKYMISRPCDDCGGGRLRSEVLGILINDINIVAVNKMTIEAAAEYFSTLSGTLSETNQKIAYQIIKEINTRLKFLLAVGLAYLTLDRGANTLAGGEAQRIRLATQIGSGLTGVLYILDEPSIGLHQRDNDKLLDTLKKLRDLGNTVIVVEHDEATMRQADYLIDIGPRAGKYGGEVVACGLPSEVEKADTLTGQYLRGEKKIAVPKVRRTQNKKRMLTVVGATENNLRNITASLPLGNFVAVTGVSGSGKSTLIYDILARALSKKFHRAQTDPGKHQSIEGLENLDKVIDIDQSPIGRTPRSNPVTYTGAFTPIRELFASNKEAKARGYKAGRFSFNVKGGRCENCAGDGVIKIEMNFLPDVYITCEECKGRRYNEEALDILYKGKNISEVLEMTVDEALPFFENVPAIKAKLETLADVGLGYIHLGQPATTLSGGEAQRIKLASELSRRATGKTLYILDEPTTGLHFEDINHLLNVLQKLVDKGNSVVVIEHNLDVIKCADWIIDLGPEGGDKGGEIIAIGSPEDVAKVEKSYTGQYLKDILKN
ncbi:MAG: UvrABC system protein A [Berkelbacteria bacterium GW2011_GWA2_38_9]|uniref:UvrABC system protein A n=1 Tax=Berkelbacteria bacterium GW2011_GWA2_38_9 TaxID=1618334 RepID=A0A0G0LFT8_9BACT|nr:MAG: UvrABC system protein A [Berkelbacteria bacterium GW2011_GWA2_38_9]